MVSKFVRLEIQTQQIGKTGPTGISVLLMWIGMPQYVSFVESEVKFK